MKTIYLDIFSGISGDMFIGAMLDLGLDFHQFEHELEKLGLDDYHLPSRVSSVAASPARSSMSTSNMNINTFMTSRIIIMSLRTSTATGTTPIPISTTRPRPSINMGTRNTNTTTGERLPTFSN
jgi:uncharacterized protein (DUF111 family)